MEQFAVFRSGLLEQLVHVICVNRAIGLVGILKLFHLIRREGQKRDDDRNDSSLNHASDAGDVSLPPASAFDQQQIAWLRWVEEE